MTAHFIPPSEFHFPPHEVQLPPNSPSSVSRAGAWYNNSAELWFWRTVQHVRHRVPSVRDHSVTWCTQIHSTHCIPRHCIPVIINLSHFTVWSDHLIGPGTGSHIFPLSRVAVRRVSRTRLKLDSLFLVARAPRLEISRKRRGYKRALC